MGWLNKVLTGNAIQKFKEIIEKTKYGLASILSETTSLKNIKKQKWSLTTHKKKRRPRSNSVKLSREQFGLDDFNSLNF